MDAILQNLATIRSTLPTGVTLVAVSKFHPAEAILSAYRAGQRIFGESRVQELVAKQAILPKDIEWHFIGHLQTNKVKGITPFISLIHSIDSPHLLAEVNRCAGQNNRTVDCLLQLHIAREESKFGFSFDECRDYLSSGNWRDLSHIRLCGVMGIASLTEEEAAIRQEFSTLQDFFTEIKSRYFPQEDSFKEISMGMSHDYRLALDYGTTMVRMG
ncbi:MAG: YggS family pyridoxal phosphate-dependent enzyme, partial [Porphyromonadaceae bacterium]|nr:YggS family pyridoxal phosphate-dependent enzyme [Porphyromonadaceae bacterium]